MLNHPARRLAGLFFVGMALVQPTAAQPAIPATREDAVRVHVSFRTIDLLMQRCGNETGDAAAFEDGRLEWVARHDHTRHLADMVLAHYAEPVSEAYLQKRAETDVAGMLESIVTPAELCQFFLAKIYDGSMDLSELVPDLHDRLVRSDEAITGASQ